MGVTFERVQHRLRAGRPLVTDADTCAAFRARGVVLDTPGAVGELLRRRPRDVLEHYRAEVASKVTVLTALTADTTPRSLAEVGMEHRSALLTGLAVEMALEAAAASEKPVAVAGVLGSELLGPVAVARMREELEEHAMRIATAGVELILARGQGSHVELMAAVAAGAATELPTWAAVECLPGGELVVGGPVGPLAAALLEAGASALLFEVSSIDDGIALLDAMREIGMTEDMAPGVLLSGSSQSVRGFPDPRSDPPIWAARALELDTHGARIIGGGAGTTEEHTAALAEELGALHPSLPQGLRQGSG